MSTSSSILIYGTDLDLIKTRRMVLEHAGFHVTLALSLQQTTDLLASRSFDLFILCHSLSPLESEPALTQAHTLRPEMKNLILSTPLSSCRGAAYDAHLTAFAPPETLIALARELTTHADPNFPEDQQSHA